MKLFELITRSRSRTAAPLEEGQVLANGRIVLYEQNGLLTKAPKPSCSRDGSGTIRVEEMTADRCRYCSSLTAVLVNPRKKKWKCSTCGKKYGVS